jgi:aminoglycoside 6'-N-acetyltransferase
MVHLRNATAADLDLLRHWDSKPHVIEANLNDDWGWKTELNRSPDWRDVPGDLRAIDTWIGEEDYLGKGYGTKMLQHAIDRCFADPKVTAILVDPLASNTASLRFYERLGFRLVERRRFGDDDCFVSGEY